MADPYSVLGVPRTATDDDIRKVFRKLAKKHHSDLNPAQVDAGAAVEAVEAPRSAGA
jgi:curved DNA-binding protein CbpA